MSNRPRLLVLASTYPRWQDDPEPGFVHELSRRLTERFEVAVLAPHAAGAKSEEIMEGVHVFRYRYAPARWETLVNAGGIINNLKRRPWKWLLVPVFLLAQMWATWRLIRRWHPDVIHAHWLIPQGLLVAMLASMDRHIPPLVVTSHGADLFALRAAPLVALKRFVIRHAAAITVVSRVMQDEVSKLGADIARISVQPMG
ncbi:MAG: glycosyltransferase, partial [Gammaproteobacteria bacterium]